LDLAYNPLVIPPKPVVNKGTPVILNWLRRNEKEGRKHKIVGLTIKETGS